MLLDSSCVQYVYSSTLPPENLVREYYTTRCTGTSLYLYDIQRTNAMMARKQGLLLLLWSQTVLCLAADLISTYRSDNPAATLSQISLADGQKPIARVRRRPPFAQTFLPAAYPTRTPPGYLKFVFFSVLQDVSTQLRSIVATQRILQGVGVGDASATALAAVSQFLVRDGAGVLATLLFSSTANIRAVKQWRLRADVLVDIGIFLEVLAASFPAHFLPLICVGNMCKAVCGVAAGAAGSAISYHWASNEKDLADVVAKSHAQHTVTSTIGLVLAALVTRALSQSSLGSPRLLWSVFGFLTFVHLAANVQCMRLLALDYLDTTRMVIAASSFLQGKAVPSPMAMTRLEPLLWGRRIRSIQFGADFGQWMSSQLDKGLARAMVERQRHLPYWILPGKGKSVAVILQGGLTPKQQMKAYFHAMAIQQGTTQDIDQAWNRFSTECQTVGWRLTKTDLQGMGYEVKLDS